MHIFHKAQSFLNHQSMIHIHLHQYLARIIHFGVRILGYCNNVHDCYELNEEFKRAKTVMIAECSLCKIY